MAIFIQYKTSTGTKTVEADSFEFGSGGGITIPPPIGNPSPPPTADRITLTFDLGNGLEPQFPTTFEVILTRTSSTGGPTEYARYTFNGAEEVSVSVSSGGERPLESVVYSYTSVDFKFTPCFCSGTLILTEIGAVAVEALCAGDVVVTVSGARRRIRWLGHRTVAAPKYDLWPVRVAAHAFGPALPTRDLYLSPGHPVLIGADADGEGGHLVPIMCLVNGTTINRVEVDTVTYWHVELDKHDILLAEGLPAESYLDWGDRTFFTEGAEHALANPDFVVPGLAGRCRPVAVDGMVVEAERRRLDMVFAKRLSSASAWPDAQEPAFEI